MHIIFLDNEVNKRKGGPSGYIANLENSLLNRKEECNIKVLSKNKITNKKIFINKLNKENWLVKKILQFKIKNYNYKKYLNSRMNWEKKLLPSDEISGLELLNDDRVKSIHAHSTEDFVKVSNYLNNRDISKIKILTSHSPKAKFKECFDYDIDTYGINRAKALLKHNEDIDKYAFSQADVIIFPCREAMEAYELTWEEFPQIIEKKDIRYIVTGTDKLDIKINRDEYRKQLGIHPDDFVVSYVGRHNEAKGYDILKKAAEIVWRKEREIKFIIGGKEGPLYQLDDSRWIEVGWTKDPGSLINSSDIFILPNKTTYFDLVMLEVMSIKMPIIASYTGGNKYVNNLSKGVICYEGNEEALANEIINAYKNNKIDSNYLKAMGKDNYNVYINNFTLESFSENYINLINNIYKDYGVN